MSETLMWGSLKSSVSEHAQNALRSDKGMKKFAAVGNTKLSDFAELRQVVVSHSAAMKRLRG